ncbi:hypothetical protein SCALM49S_09116 [Streptomyces californicus]
MTLAGSSSPAATDFFGHTALGRTEPARVWRSPTRTTSPSPRARPAPGPFPLPSLADVDAVVLDFDGTQTDDRVMIDSDGPESVATHRGDGLGIAATTAGVLLRILSTEQNPVVAAPAPWKPPRAWRSSARFLPLELIARRGPIGRTVMSFPRSSTPSRWPSTGTGVNVAVCDIAPEWLRTTASPRAQGFLRGVTETARGVQRLSSVTT